MTVFSPISVEQKSKLWRNSEFQATLSLAGYMYAVRVARFGGVSELKWQCCLAIQPPLTQTLDNRHNKQQIRQGLEKDRSVNLIGFKQSDR